MPLSPTLKIDILFCGPSLILEEKGVTSSKTLSAPIRDFSYLPLMTSHSYDVIDCTLHDRKRERCCGREKQFSEKKKCVFLSLLKNTFFPFLFNQITVFPRDRSQIKPGKYCPLLNRIILGKHKGANNN